MSLASFQIKYGEWRAISSGGQNGTCWIKDTGDGSTTIIVAHTDSVQTAGTPTGDNIPWATAVDLDKDIGKEVLNDGSVSPPLSADNAGDIFYVTKLDDDSNDVTVIADFY